MKSAPSAAARLRVERLVAIQAAFGLSTQDFARVLGLSRPGLCKWLDSSKDVKLQKASRLRLAVVARIAVQWRARSPMTLRSVANEPLAGDRTALTMVTAPTIDVASVLDALDALDELMAQRQSKPRSRSQRLADAGFLRRPSARALPADE